MDEGIQDAVPRLRLWDKVRLATRIWAGYVRARHGLRRYGLPQLMERLRNRRSRLDIWIEPKRLGHIVGRALRLGPIRARCLLSALVLYQLLREQGDEAQLVIGLPREPKHKDAHAWVEMGSVDVGPPPGRGIHEPLARFG